MFEPSRNSISATSNCDNTAKAQFSYHNDNENDVKIYNRK